MTIEVATSHGEGSNYHDIGLRLVDAHPTISCVVQCYRDTDGHKRRHGEEQDEVQQLWAIFGPINGVSEGTICVLKCRY